MANKKISPSKKAERETDTLTPEEAAAPPIGRRIVVEKTIRSEPLTEEAAEGQGIEEEDNDESLESFEEIDGLSADLLNFFDEDNNDDRHTLRVYQITKPTSGVRFMKGNNIFRGEIPYARTFLKDVQEQFGGGVFRLQVVGTWTHPETGRTKFGILKSRTVTIAAAPRPYMPDDPTQPAPANVSGAPQVPYLLQTPGMVDSTPAPTMKENLTDLVAMIRLVDQLRGGPNAQAQAPQLDPEVAAFTLIAKNPDVMGRISDNMARSILGDKAVSNDGPWALLGDIVRSGQAPEIIGAIVRELVAPIRSAIAGAPPQNGAQHPMPPQAPPAFPGQPPAPGPEAPAGMDPAQAQAQARGPADPQQLPEDHALQLLMVFCTRKTPPQMAASRLLGYADYLNANAPQYSLDDYLDAFITMTPEAALEIVKTQPGGEAVAALPHARDWTEALQVIIKQQSQHAFGGMQQ